MSHDSSRERLASVVAQVEALERRGMLHLRHRDDFEPWPSNFVDVRKTAEHFSHDSRSEIVTRDAAAE